MLARNGTSVIQFYRKKTWLAIPSKYFSSFSPQGLTKLSAKTSNFLVHCNTQITKYGRNGNIKEAESVFSRMPTKNTISYTAMLCAYAQNGQISNARKLFDETPCRSVPTWNAMITAYIRSGVTDEAFRLFLCMPERNEVSHAAMTTGFVNAGRYDEAERLYGETPVEWRDPFCSNVLVNGYLKSGKLEEAVRIFQKMVVKDVVSCTSMVDGYCKSGRVGEARELFDAMGSSKNEVTWCCMINGYMKAGCFEDGFELFLRMRREGLAGVEPTTLTIVLEACGSFDRYAEGCQMHGLVARMGFGFDVFLGNSVITMYSKLGFADAARNAFDSMNKKDVVSWNSLISGYVQAGMLEEAYELFNKLDAKDAVSWTTMITGFSNKGFMKNCIELFNRMPERDDVAWTALITGFVNNENPEEAIRWFIQMLRSATRPNPLTLSSVLSASGSLASLSQGLQIHAHIFKLDKGYDISIQNSLVSMYSKCGNVKDAYRIFKSISAPNIVSFNSIITGFAQHGLGKEALEVFQLLEDQGHKPNDITFLGALSACNHVGLVEEGWKHFISMESYKVAPGPDHYACMVDLLGKAGLLDEAVKLIKSMPFEPHSGVWCALLGRSRIHLRLDLAELAAWNILQLEPNNSAPYVVLSDIYNLVGKRKDEEQMRLLKRLNRVRKSPGCSWITVRNRNNLFLSGDRYHIDFEEMKSTLCTILWEMKLPHCAEEDLLLV